MSPESDWWTKIAQDRDQLVKGAAPCPVCKEPIAEAKRVIAGAVLRSDFRHKDGSACWLEQYVEGKMIAEGRRPDGPTRHVRQEE